MDFEITLLSINELDNCIKEMPITDISLLMGGSIETIFNVSNNLTFAGRAGTYYTKDFIDGSVIYLDGTASSVLREDSVLDSCKSIRPVLKFNKDLTKELKTKKVMLGMYPQYVVDLEKQIKIEKNFKYKKLLLTGNSYTFPNGKSYEYEYNGERFVRVINNSNCPVVLSNGLIYHKDWYAWVKVEPVIWIVKENMLVSSKGLLSGIPFNNSQEFSEFKDTVISRFINENIKKELFQDKNQTRIIEIEKDIIKSKQYKINYFDIL